MLTERNCWLFGLRFRPYIHRCRHCRLI